MADITFEGGINEQDDAKVNIAECTEGYNFELGLSNTRFRPRKPFKALGSVFNTSRIGGFIQLIKRDNTETTLIQAGDKIYLWDIT
jgi:hypothetical protein